MTFAIHATAWAASLSLSSPKRVITTVAARMPLSVANLQAPTTQERMRVGRGSGSGKGKHAGRGSKGYLQRQGRRAPVPGFIGGASSLLRAIPKLGTRPDPDGRMTVVPLARIVAWVKAGRLDASKPIGIADLVRSGVIGSIEKGGVKLLMSPALERKANSSTVSAPRTNDDSAISASPYTTELSDHATVDLSCLPPLRIVVNRASRTAIAAVEATGGKVTCVWMDSLVRHAATQRGKFLVAPRLGVPTSFKLLGYYTSPQTRGYLAPLVHDVTNNLELLEILHSRTTTVEGRVVVNREFEHLLGDAVYLV